nr:transposase [Desulfopila inferna]
MISLKKYQWYKRLNNLNYIATSNHIHMLVVDTGEDVIPKRLQLIAGRTAQEYNIRKNRKGAFWEDRYHPTAVQADQHLAKCLVYIDLTMVRAGVVRNPSAYGITTKSRHLQTVFYCIMRLKKMWLILR